CAGNSSSEKKLNSYKQNTRLCLFLSRRHRPTAWARTLGFARLCCCKQEKITFKYSLCVTFGDPVLQKKVYNVVMGHIISFKMSGLGTHADDADCRLNVDEDFTDSV
ncbi:Methylenetetrahydrofolate--tRNA-(uracil-5-)-methyltransferase, partial [Frankliniella fusca]